MTTLPPFMKSADWTMFPSSFLRLMDPNAAMVVGKILREKEKHDGQDFPLDEWVVHDAAHTFGWSKKYYNNKLDLVVNAGYAARQIVGTVVSFKLDLVKLQTLVDAAG